MTVRETNLEFKSESNTFFMSVNMPATQVFIDKDI